PPRDPLRFAAGAANLYPYCGGSPTGSVDPSGLLSDGNHHSGGSSDGKWYSHRDDALRDSSWNLFNPKSPGFLPFYLGDAVWHAFSTAPGLARGAFVDGRARVDDKYSSAEDTLVNRSLHALESSVYYAGEAGAYGGIGVGAYGMGGLNWAVGQQTGVFNVENWEKVDDFVQDLTTTKPPKKTGPNKHNRSLKFEKLEERAAEGAPVLGNTLKPR
ncbi:MAG: hypothetical protein U1E05_14310, partial [Patescibacteria group bacterium]|nr:hypothetical protein [Patescibacteria group bacterium]